MIRLAWRQFRAAAILAASGLLAVVVVVAVTRPRLVQAAADARRVCGDQSGCPAMVALAHSDLPPRTALGLLVVVVPALIGAFWGAPMVAREYEAGTHRLVWAQRITRTRWLAVKLAVAGAAAVLTSGLLSALVTWWAAPVDHAGAAVYGTFDQRGITPVGYALFGFALGVAAGLLTRRTLPAMTITLGGLLAVRIVVTQWVRPLAFTPRVANLALDPDTTGYGSSGNILLGVPPATLQPATPDLPDAWIQSVRIVDAAGHPLTRDVLHATCPAIGHPDGGGAAGGHRPVPAAVRQTMHDCVVRVGATYHETVTYQPGSRYWGFQWWELAVYVAAAALLCGYALFKVRRCR